MDSEVGKIMTMNRGVCCFYLRQYESRRGFTIVEGLVGLLLVSLAALLLSSIISFNKASQVRLDDRVGIQNILLESVADIRYISYDDILAFCTIRNGLNANILNQSNCFDNPNNPQTLSTNSDLLGPATVAGVAKPIEVRKNIQTGRPDMNGKACIALETCRELIPNQLIEVTLAGIWLDPNPSKSPKYNLTRQVFRRTRW